MSQETNKHKSSLFSFSPAARYGLGPLNDHQAPRRACNGAN